MRKITLVICEGPSDKRVLLPLFPQSEYVIVHGDFITNNNLHSHANINENNVLNELNRFVINVVKKTNNFNQAKPKRLCFFIAIRQNYCCYNIVVENVIRLVK